MSSKKGDAGPHRHSRSWSLAARLTVWYALSSFTLVLLATGYLYWALARNLDRADDHFLADQALPLINLLREAPDRSTLRRQVELAWPARPDPPVYFRVLDERQKEIAATPGMALVIERTDFAEAQPFDRNTIGGQNFRSAEDRPFRMLAVRTGAEPFFIVQVARDRSHAVRADVTYLRQDFSLLQEVADAAPWPALQRFDFLVRERVLTDEEAQAYRAEFGEQGENSPYRQAAGSALRELTGSPTGSPTRGKALWIALGCTSLVLLPGSLVYRFRRLSARRRGASVAGLSS